MLDLTLEALDELCNGRAVSCGLVLRPWAGLFGSLPLVATSLASISPFFCYIGAPKYVFYPFSAYSRTFMAKISKVADF